MEDRTLHIKEDYEETAFSMEMRLHFLAIGIMICSGKPHCAVLVGHGMLRYQNANVSVLLSLKCGVDKNETIKKITIQH